MTNIVYTCDRCGQVINNKPIRIMKPFGLTIITPDYKYDMTHKAEIDLCEDCLEDFDNFMQECKYD